MLRSGRIGVLNFRKDLGRIFRFWRTLLLISSLPGALDFQSIQPTALGGGTSSGLNPILILDDWTENQS